MAETKSNNGLKVLAGLLLLLLVGTVIYTFSLYKDKQDTTAKLNKEKELVVEDFPCFVAYDIYGGNIFERESNNGWYKSKKLETSRRE